MVIIEPTKRIYRDGQSVIEMRPVSHVDGNCVQYPLVVGVYRKRDWLARMLVKIYLREHRN